MNYIRSSNRNNDLKPSFLEAPTTTEQKLMSLTAWEKKVWQRIHKVNKEWKSKAYIPLSTKWVEERTRELLTMYWQDYNIRKKESEAQKIKTEVKVCISWADSWLWSELTTRNNVGNVGNDDRWRRVHFASIEAWIRAIGSLALNWTRLKRKQTIGDLSRAWNCKIDCRQFYATSTENRNLNTINCLSNIYDKQIDHTFLFRL